MAEEQNEEETPENDEEKLDRLEGQARKSRKLLFGVGISSVVFLIVLVGGFVSIGFKISADTQAPLQEMREVEEGVQAGFNELNEAIANHELRMQEFENRLSTLDPAIDKSQFVRLEEILMSQEKDFQYFLATLNEGIGSLSGMVQGSRVWRNEFEQKINAAIARSQERENRMVYSKENPVSDELMETESMGETANKEG